MTTKILHSALLTAAAVFSAVTSAHMRLETRSTPISRTLSNIPGKSLVAVEVSYPPGGVSQPPNHEKSAFIVA